VVVVVVANLVALVELVVGELVEQVVFLVQQHNLLMEALI